MTVYYELRSVGALQASNLASNLVEVSADEAAQSLLPVVGVVDPARFCEMDTGDCADLEAFADSESTFVDVYQNYIMGSFSVPSRSMDPADPDTFAFYLDKKQLIFVDKGDAAQRILAGMVQSGVMRTTSTAHCLYVFMKDLMADDLEFMGKVEDQMEDMEEGMMDSSLDLTTGQIMRCRRLAMRFSAFYQQMATMAAMISDDENKMMSREEARQFDHLENLADRLGNRADTLREYSLQLHELHQTRIDLRQNSIMQVLTIVTVLLAPMTLVTGWFGMNLATLPGASMDVMWAVLIGAFVLCTVLLLFLFRRKKWL